MFGRRRQPPVVVVTSAGLSHTDDMRLRLRRYAWTQAARITCFVLAVTLPVPLIARLLLIAGAVALPWMGVVAANAGPVVSRTKPSPAPVMPLRPPGYSGPKHQHETTTELPAITAARIIDQ